MNDLLFPVLTFFVFLSAVALCIQAAMLIGMWKTTKTLQQQVTSMLPKVQSVLTRVESTLDENRKNILEATSKASDIVAKTNEIVTKTNEIAARTNEMATRALEMMDIGKAQLVKLDAVLTDASDRAKAQLERAELVVDDTLGRVNQTVTAVHNGVLRPVKEIQAVTAGFRAAMQHLMRGGRPSVADATHDDEMFIG